ncbi:MAG: 30S ribosomal protein S19e [Candidatus Hadarchaeales archaeon]
MKVEQVKASVMIDRLKEELKKYKELEPPPWSYFVKTGVHAERPPMQPDWWYIRAASILRKIYLKGPIGVSRLRTIYGGKQRRGQSPEKFKKGGGKIIRTILQQLERAGLIVKVDKKGRKPSKTGVELLERLAEEIVARGEECGRGA